MRYFITYVVSGAAISMYTHTGTHIDALNHFGLRGEVWNGFKADDHLGDRGWRRTGVEKFPPIVARGVLVDEDDAVLRLRHDIGVVQLGARLAQRLRRARCRTRRHRARPLAARHVRVKQVRTMVFRKNKPCAIKEMSPG